jgi:hemolysin activation/secretion protein
MTTFTHDDAPVRPASSGRRSDTVRGRLRRGIAAGLMRRGAGLLALGALALATSGLFEADVHAQTPAQVPRPSDLAPPVRPPGSAAAPGLVDEQAQPSRELGKPEDDVRVDVTRYIVADDAPPELKKALPALTQPYVGPQRGFEDLINAAADVTRFLQRDLGYYLGYAYLPEQAPVGGQIRIAVLEGRLDRVVLNWVDGLPVDRQVVEAYLARLKPGSILRVRDVERVIFLVNDLRGINATFEVRPGRKRGTAQLVVTPTADKTLSGRLEADMNGNRAIGRYRLAALAQINSILGVGDGLTVTGLASNTGGLAFGLLGYTLPVGSDGLKLGSAVSGVRYQLDKKLFPVNLQGTAVTGNVYALYPVVRSRNLNLFGLLSLDTKRYTDRQRLANTSTRKTVNLVSLGTSGDFRDSLAGGGVSTYELTLATGRVTYPGGRPGGLDDAARFTKVNYGYTRLQDLLTGRLLGYLSLRGQYTRHNLDSTEQFRLGGSDGLRGFSSGEGTGDLGAVLTTELRLLPLEEWVGRNARDMVVSLFSDVGMVRYRIHPTVDPLQQALSNTDHFSDVGLGLAWVRPNEFALRASLARPVAGKPRNTSDARDTRFYLSYSYPFN